MAHLVKASSRSHETLIDHSSDMKKSDEKTANRSMWDDSGLKEMPDESPMPMLNLNVNT